ncbi:Ig-like domain-containing protein [Bacillus sp. 31A1R]|uniref:Ig-like domain-containing protein n=1 Tax=Robertmurraya mangrovi TaxID=3098077 RepID=A0ABU5IWG0_9BACI|nr:Ig-like domain-containing protein [Bacillus sp. 31A1R]MDZ5471471.1 Ig-like domain-containing protein [Bacillus sp. 31A1R]
MKLLKLYKIFTWFLIIVMLTNFIPQYLKVEANEGTTVSGTIDVDTTWSKAGSPYKLTGILTIPRNVKLTIEPGVSVVGKIGTWIDVKGKLIAIGGEPEQERIKIDTTYINAWDFLETFVHLENADVSRGYNGGYLVTGENIILKNNLFSNGTILISNPTMIEPVVTGNVFQNNSTISLWLGAKQTIITNNTFFNGPDIHSSGDISIGCSYECIAPNLQLSHNNFFGLNHPYIYLTSNHSFTFNGGNNYWGTTDQTKINQFIVDGNDNMNFRGILITDPIYYKPFNHGHPLGELTPPVVKYIGDHETVITGVTDADSTVEVLDSFGGKIATGLSKSDGTFSITIPLQKSGTEIHLISTDSFGRTSAATITKVIDMTAPIAPVVHELNDAMFFISGTAEPSSTITVTSSEKLIGTVTANQEGYFNIYTGQLKANSIFQIQAEDQAGHKSPIVQVTVKDVTPPTKPELTREITNESNTITGVAEKDSTIVIKANDREMIRQRVYTGTFNSYISNQKSGTNIEIYSIDQAGNKSESLTTVVKDVTPPYLIVLKLSDSAKSLIGMSNVGATITVLKNGEEIGKGTVIYDYGFSIDIPAQSAGTKLTVVSTSVNGMKTSKEVIVEDLTPPDAPMVDIITDQSNMITGNTEASAYIQLYINSIEVAAITADEKGSFSIPIAIQKAGTVIQLTAKDQVGNISMPTKVIVKDITPPSLPQVNNVTNKANSISGKTERFASVTAKIGTKTYTTSVNENGNFSLSIPVQNSGTSISITAKDLAGNVSETKMIKVTRVAPNIPVVNTVSNKSTSITGKTEKYAIISIKIGTKTYSGKADRYGNYKVSIPVQNSGTSFTVTAKDSGGKISYGKVGKVVRIAPDIPVVNTVKYYSTTITGKAGKRSTVIAKIGTKTYSSKASSYGNFKIPISKQRVGTTIYVYAKDSRGNLSVKRTVKVK